MIRAVLDTNVLVSALLFSLLPLNLFQPGKAVVFAQSSLPRYSKNMFVCWPIPNSILRIQRFSASLKKMSSLSSTPFGHNPSQPQH